MSYQILGLREYVDPKTKRLKNRHAFFEKNWRVPDLSFIYSDPEAALAPVPESDRVNLYYTVADCFDEKARQFKEQWVIPFDIDDLGIETGIPDDIKTHCLKVLGVACAAIGVDATKTSAVFSGNGIQFFVRLPRPIQSEDYFETARELYKIVCEKIQVALTTNHYKGKVDTSVWSAARLMRFPNTWNVKPEKGKKRAFVIQPNLEAQDFILDEVVGDAQIKRADTIDKEAWRQKHYHPDTKGVLGGCDFLKWAKENPNKVDEAQWYAMLGVTSFLKDGDKYGHEYSEGYTGYDFNETQEKIDQAKRASGPRTCKDISARWDGCGKCQYNSQVKSPIMIQSEDYVATKDTGFRKVMIADNGVPSPGKVEYEDLIKFFLAEFEFIKVNKNGMYVYASEEKKWIPFSEDEARSWCRKQVEPKPSKHEMAEFVARLQAENVRPKDWLDRADDVHINFTNGVLDRSTMELKPHDSKYGFKYVLPFPYDATSKAPLFENFLNEVLCGDKELVQLIKEFGGYCLSGDEYWEHKALVLVGEGSNGKSVFMEVLKAVAGSANACSIPMRDLMRAETRWALVNKLLNCSEETSIDSFIRSDVFKTLASGGEVQVRHYYEQPFDYRNKSKLILSCNEMPTTKDTTHGMFRRLTIVPFNRVFGKKERDPFLKSKLVAEASGIYNVLLSAYAQMKKRKSLVEAAASNELLSQYTYDNSPIHQFVDECIGYAEGKSTPMAEIYRAYSDFCVARGYKDYIKSAASFSRQVAKATDGKVAATPVWQGNRTIRAVQGVIVNEVF